MFKFVLKVLFVGYILLLSATNLYADNIRGIEDSRFQSALNTWLDGEDEVALKAFAALAREENRAAQILLAQIHDKPWLNDHVTAKLDRKQRIQLMREPKGLSGRSWLVSAAHDTPLARHLLDAKEKYENTKIGEALFASGELDAAFPLIERALGPRDILGALTLALNDRALPYTSGFVIPAVRHLPVLLKSGWFSADDPRLQKIKNRLHLLRDDYDVGRILWGRMSFQDMQPHSKEFLEIGEKLARVPGLKPIVQILERYCPKNVSGSLVALQVANFGKPLNLNMFSPIESILPTPQYQSSKRFEMDIVRRIGHYNKAEHLRKYYDCAFNLFFSQEY